MDNRKWQAAASASAPDPEAAPDEGYPTDGDPSSAVPATVPGAYWFHQVGEEIRNVIVDGGLTPDDADLTQLSAAIQALISDAQINVPAGQVMYFAQNTAPTGYLKANGAAISRTTYADLFAAIGTTFGAGDGSTTFNLPDLRGEFLRAWDDSRGIDSGRVFGSAQSDALKAHTHDYIRDASGSSFTGGGGINSNNNNATATTTSTGGTETRPRNIALLACIKY